MLERNFPRGRLSSQRASQANEEKIDDACVAVYTLYTSSITQETILPTALTPMRLTDTDLAILEEVRQALAAKSTTDAVRQSLRIAAKSLKIDVKKILKKTEKIA